MVRGHKNELQPFNRDQLFLAIYECCKHRPHALPDATALTDVITTHAVAKQKDGIIERDDLARAAHLALKRFDKVAATFYAAYHPF